jgi:hypothetical protein
VERLTSTISSAQSFVVPLCQAAINVPSDLLRTAGKVRLARSVPGTLRLMTPESMMRMKKDLSP